MLGALAAAIIILCNSLGMVQANSPKQDRAAILVTSKNVQGPITTTASGGSFSPTIGKQVYWVEASAGCPEIQPGAALGPALALLLEKGFRLEYVTGDSYFFTR